MTHYCCCEHAKRDAEYGIRDTKMVPDTQNYPKTKEVCSYCGLKVKKE